MVEGGEAGTAVLPASVAEGSVAHEDRGNAEIQERKVDNRTLFNSALETLLAHGEHPPKFKRRYVLNQRVAVPTDGDDEASQEIDITMKGRDLRDKSLGSITMEVSGFGKVNIQKYSKEPNSAYTIAIKEPGKLSYHGAKKDQIESLASIISALKQSYPENASGDEPIIEQTADSQVQQSTVREGDLVPA